jgi:hypothetical protein
MGEGLKYLEEAMDEFVAEIDLIGSVATRTGYMLEHMDCWSMTSSCWCTVT